MRRMLVVAGLAGLAALAGLLVLMRPSPVEAQKNPEPVAAPRPSAQLPIGQVILYSSGVGYFQREGSVEGNARVDLSFPVTDINDLLKSMVLRDMGGGQISTISYDSHDPVDRTLKSFAINLNANPSLGGILNQARGEKVETVLQQSNATQPGTITGVIMGVEKQKQAAGKDAAVEVEIINLWCAEGMRSVKLADVQRIRFLNPIMETEVKKALETLALSHDTQKKAVSISFTGEGKREVRVGYVIENPIWKTSYRLVLDKKEEKPYLQGWAVVENPSDEDWNGVRMALVSGRPISFKMDLYQPLYVPRPTVEPELFASLRPPTFEGGINGNEGKPVAGAKPRSELLGVEGEELAQKKGKEAEARGLYEQGRRQADSQLKRRMADEKLDLKSSGVRDVATASQLGDFFQYVIDNPVNLARQKSALLPIVNKEVEGTRVSIYNQATHPKFPLLGLRFKNTSGLHLMQGPITVFEGASYAGDARILDLQPNEERLLAYAVDLGTEVNPVIENPKQNITKVRAVRGIIHTTTRIVESKTYQVTNRSEHDRLVLLEHPFRGDFAITSKDKAKETTREVYRFELKVAPGKTASQTIVEEKDLLNQYVISNTNDGQIRYFISQGVTSAKAKEALERSLEMKAKRDVTRQELASAQQHLGDLERDQDRLRKNLKETPPTSEAYKKYLVKLDEQEGEIDKLTKQIKDLRIKDLQQTKDYDSFLANLDID